MKIKLDTINKTIKIEEEVNLHDFYEQLNALLPDGKWREYSLCVEVVRLVSPTPTTPIIPMQQPYYPPVVNPYNDNIRYTTHTTLPNFNNLQTES
jgi:hypothetical protein